MVSKGVIQVIVKSVSKFFITRRKMSMKKSIVTGMLIIGMQASVGVADEDALKKIGERLDAIEKKMSDGVSVKKSESEEAKSKSELDKFSYSKKLELLTLAYSKRGYSKPAELAKIALDHDFEVDALSVLLEDPKSTPKSLGKWLESVQVDGDRLIAKEDHTFPRQLVCSANDKRVLNLCIVPEYFKPKISAFYDKGNDVDGKVDVFKNGSANVSLDLIGVSIPLRFGRSEFFDSWTWGPNIGLGIGSPSGDSKEDNSTTSSSPVVLLTYGLRSQYKPKAKGFSFAVEFGRANAYTTDEGFDDKNDKANYIGFTMSIPTD
jgi:hypothetical protein